MFYNFPLNYGPLNYEIAGLRDATNSQDKHERPADIFPGKPRIYGPNLTGRQTRERAEGPKLWRIFNATPTNREPFFDEIRDSNHPFSTF